MSSAFKTRRWVGIRPLKHMVSVKDASELNPRVYIAKLYESLEMVLESLWSHHYRFEASEVGTLLVSEQGGLLTNMLALHSHDYFSSRETSRALGAFVGEKNSKRYPGHAVVCLFVLAKARDNGEMQAALDLCESIAQCLSLISTHLNQGSPEPGSEKIAIDHLVQRWKKIFPYSD